MSKLDTAPYKGVRDFYPEDMEIQNYIFDTWKKVAKSFGYVEYSASILEPAELYKNKTSEEIVNEQTFSFKDRGDREVVLRPEMTPSLARMIAARRRNLKFPLRWFSIPNLFRYEQPQRGRKREHWQLNCDIIGIPDIKADIEIIELAHDIMEAFGAEDKDFEIRVNDRKASMKGLREKRDKLTEEQEQKLLRLRDKKGKIPEEKYQAGIAEIIGENLDIESEESDDVKLLIEKLEGAGIKNIKFSPTLTRGFDYYTGIVFEVFDTHPDNRRSLFGGGRYDNLLEMFGVEPVPAVGFGMGDITLRDFLETHKLLPNA
jgi:histidyl-tRNA synthetase